MTQSAPIASLGPLDEVQLRLLREPDPRDRVAVLRHNIAKMRWLRETRPRRRGADRTRLATLPGGITFLDKLGGW